MTGFDLPYNFDPNPEIIGRIVRQRTIPPQKRLSLDEGLTKPALSPMAPKTLRQFSAPSSSHIPIGLNTDHGNEGFELKTGLVNMVQTCPFCVKALEDANAHLHFSASEQHNQPQRYYTGYCSNVSILILSAWESKDVVLHQRGSIHHLACLFLCISGQVLFGGQSQRHSE
jgi:hypothetical protein